MKYYAGIGSRETPAHVCQMMTVIARKLSSFGYICNSGGADGSDAAFELGAKHKQIFLPWDGFNGRKANGTDYIVPHYNEELVRKYHPKVSALSEKGWKFMSRNSYQVLGRDLNTPVEFVLCWTREGKLKGGTAQALRIAKDKGIRIFNFYHGYNEFADYMTRSNFFG